MEPAISQACQNETSMSTRKKNESRDNLPFTGKFIWWLRPSSSNQVTQGTETLLCLSQTIQKVTKLIFHLSHTVTFCESIKGLSKQKCRPEEQEANKQRKSKGKSTPGADTDTVPQQQRYGPASGGHRRGHQHSGNSKREGGDGVLDSRASVWTQSLEVCFPHVPNSGFQENHLLSLYSS